MGLGFIECFLFLSFLSPGIAERIGTHQSNRLYGPKIEAEKKMKIFVKTLKGSHFEIEVKPEDMVRFFFTFFTVFYCVLNALVIC